jgi:predicted ribonuclease YlaK
MKARSVRLTAEDYTTDYVRDPSHMNSGCRYVEEIPSELIAKLYEQDEEVTNANYVPSIPLSMLIDKMQGQKLYAHIDLRKGERSELAELASNIL